MVALIGAPVDESAGFQHPPVRDHLHVCRLHHSAPFSVVIVIFRVAVAVFRDVEPGVGQFAVEHHGHERRDLVHGFVVQAHQIPVGDHRGDDGADLLCHAFLVVAGGQIAGAGGERGADLLKADEPVGGVGVHVLVFEDADAQEGEQRGLLAFEADTGF